MDVLGEIKVINNRLEMVDHHFKSYVLCFFHIEPIIKIFPTGKFRKQVDILPNDVTS